MWHSTKTFCCNQQQQHPYASCHTRNTDIKRKCIQFMNVISGIQICQRYHFCWDKHKRSRYKCAEYHAFGYLSGDFSQLILQIFSMLYKYYLPIPLQCCTVRQLQKLQVPPGRCHRENQMCSVRWCHWNYLQPALCKLFVGLLVVKPNWNRRLYTIGINNDGISKIGK